MAILAEKIKAKSKISIWARSLSQSKWFRRENKLKTAEGWGNRIRWCLSLIRIAIEISRNRKELWRGVIRQANTIFRIRHMVVKGRNPRISSEIRVPINTGLLERANLCQVGVGWQRTHMTFLKTLRLRSDNSLENTKLRKFTRKTMSS